jgi:hypothetical protein
MVKINASRFKAHKDKKKFRHYAERLNHVKARGDIKQKNKLRGLSP